MQYFQFVAYFIVWILCFDVYKKKFPERLERGDRI